MTALARRPSPDGGAAPGRPAARARPRCLLFAALALALSACATGPDRVILDHPTVPLDRPNGQPRWLPCMGGDALCTPP